LLDRRVGLETELFIRQPIDPKPETLTQFFSLIHGIHERVPLAPSRTNPFRFFLANGSSVSLEVGGSGDLKSALFEIATPECKSPRDVVLYELANEQLLEEVFAKDHPSSRWSLIKANMDSQGHTLGQHESYDMRIARGGELLLWWVGLVLLLPLVVTYRLLAIAWIGLIYAVCTWIRGLHRLYQASPRLAPRERAPAESYETWIDPFLHVRSMQCTAWGLRVLHWPIVQLFLILIRVVALRPHRRYMAAFLATRSILDGAGHIDEQGRYWISQRAGMVDRMIGFGSYGAARPLFRCDPMLRDLIAGPFWSFARIRRLFSPKQRIELAIGDSGMCPWSQHIRFGATVLMIDLVEQRALRGAPRLAKPIEAMGQIARDWMLVRSVAGAHQRQHTALEIQHGYLKALKKYLESRSDVPPETWDIIDKWQTALNQLSVKFPNQESVPKMLIGKLDWISKLWLLLQLDPATSWPIRKKIDIRYHEMSEQGYHRKLVDLVDLAPVIRSDEISTARRHPPQHAPAQRRGNLIREFSGGDSDLQVEWRQATYSVDGKLYRTIF
jgi:hypothetical protein